jgi:hypothetical protein
MVVWVNAGWFRPQAIAEAADLQTIGDQQVAVPLLLVVSGGAPVRSACTAEGLLKVSATALPPPSAETGESREGQVQALADRITEMAMAAIASKGAPASTDGDVSAGKNKIETN